jgi:hypothetical protein
LLPIKGNIGNKCSLFNQFNQLFSLILITKKLE